MIGTLFRCLMELCQFYLCLWLLAFYFEIVYGYWPFISKLFMVSIALTVLRASKHVVCVRVVNDLGDVICVHDVF